MSCPQTMLKLDDFSIEVSLAIPPAVSASKRNDISIKLALSRPTQTIAEEECISTCSVQRYQKNLLNYGSTYGATSALTVWHYLKLHRN